LYTLYKYLTYRSIGVYREGYSRCTLCWVRIITVFDINLAKTDGLGRISD